MAKSKRRKKGYEHLLAHRAMRMAAKKGEQVDALREMMEISKMYANREAGAPIDPTRFEVTEIDEQAVNINKATVEFNSLMEKTELPLVTARSIPDDVIEGDVVQQQ